jgi:hypothetical protein
MGWDYVSELRPITDISTYFSSLLVSQLKSCMHFSNSTSPTYIICLHMISTGYGKWHSGSQGGEHKVTIVGCCELYCPRNAPTFQRLLLSSLGRIFAIFRTLIIAIWQRRVMYQTKLTFATFGILCWRRHSRRVSHGTPTLFTWFRLCRRRNDRRRKTHRQFSSLCRMAYRRPSDLAAS